MPILSEIKIVNTFLANLFYSKETMKYRLRYVSETTDLVSVRVRTPFQDVSLGIKRLSTMARGLSMEMVWKSLRLSICTLLIPCMCSATGGLSRGSWLDDPIQLCPSSTKYTHTHTSCAWRLLCPQAFCTDLAPGPLVPVIPC